MIDDDEMERKSRRAAEVLNDELLQEVLTDLRAEALENITRTQPSEDEAREEFYYFAMALDAVKARLHALASDYRLSQANRGKFDA
jgi:hypothetical protein